MYVFPVSLLHLPPPRRRVNQGKFAIVVRGHQPELFLRYGDGRWSAPAEHGHPPERLLRSVDACQSCAWAWRPGGAILVDFDHSKRAGVPGSSHPSPGSSGWGDGPVGWEIPGKNLLAVCKFMDGKGPLSAEHMTSENASNLICTGTVLLSPIHSLCRSKIDVRRSKKDIRRGKKDVRRSKFSQVHPPPRRRETYKWYRRSIHKLNFTYEDDFKIKNKHAAGVSTTFYLSPETISRPPQPRETIPLSGALSGNVLSDKILTGNMLSDSKRCKVISHY
jgi:hypothetical protein